MLETKPFEARESYTKLGNAIERLKATKYLKKVQKEIKYIENEKQAIEERLKFLYEEEEKVLYYRLLH